MLAAVHVPEAAASGLRVGLPAEVVGNGRHGAGKDYPGIAHRRSRRRSPGNDRSDHRRCPPDSRRRRRSGWAAEPRQVVAIPRSAVGKDGYALVSTVEKTTLRALTLGSELDGDRVEGRDWPPVKGSSGRSVSGNPSLRQDLVLVEQTYRGERLYPEGPPVA